MSEVFAAQPHQQSQMVPQPTRMHQTAPNSDAINKMLDDNTQLVTAIAEHFNKGRAQDTLEMQRTLHRNLVYLASLAYPNKPMQEVQNLIPVDLFIYIT